MTAPLLDVDFIALKPGVGTAQRRRLLRAAGRLSALPGVMSGGAIETLPGSDADVVLFFVLGNLFELESFGTDPAYAAFLQSTVGPLLAGLSGIDARVEGVMPARRANAVCLLAAAPAETYDWQVKADLTEWAAAFAPQPAAVGLAVGDRQRYRGLALAFVDGLGPPLPPAPIGYAAFVAAGRTLALG